MNLQGNLVIEVFENTILWELQKSVKKWLNENHEDILQIDYLVSGGDEISVYACIITYHKPEKQ